MFTTVKKHIARLIVATSAIFILASIQLIPIAYAGPACGATVPGC